MAFFGKDEKTQAQGPARPAASVTLPATPASRPTAAQPSADSVQTHLGKGSRVEGRLSFTGSVRIDGEVDGEIEAQDAIIIGEGAIVNALITAGTVVLKGKLKGDIVAQKRVELHAPARLSGNIATPSLVIQDGVIFEGHCSMGGATDVKNDRPEKKVAFFPDERANLSAVRAPSEAIK